MPAPLAIKRLRLGIAHRPGHLYIKMSSSLLGALYPAVEWVSGGNEKGAQQPPAITPIHFPSPLPPFPS